jgi:hypothetical protein
VHPAHPRHDGPVTLGFFASADACFRAIGTADSSVLDPTRAGFNADAANDDDSWLGDADGDRYPCEFAG